MRKINTQDVFKLARVMKKGKMSQSIAEAIEGIDVSEGEITEKAGIRIFLALFESAGDAEIESMIYELIGGIAEVEPKTIAQQDFEKTIEMFKEISENNNLIYFFKQAGRLAQN